MRGFPYAYSAVMASPQSEAGRDPVMEFELIRRVFRDVISPRAEGNEPPTDFCPNVI